MPALRLRAVCKKVAGRARIARPAGLSVPAVQNVYETLERVVRRPRDILALAIERVKDHRASSAIDRWIIDVYAALTFSEEEREAALDLQQVGGTDVAEYLP